MLGNNKLWESKRDGREEKREREIFVDISENWEKRGNQRRGEGSRDEKQERESEGKAVNVFK